MTEIFGNLWIQRLGFVVGGLVLGFLMEFVVIRRAHKLAARSRFKWDDVLIGSVRGLATLGFGAGGVYLALNVGPTDPRVVNIVQGALMVLVLGSVVIAGMRAVGGAVEMLSDRAGGAIKSPTLVVNLARIAVGILGLFIILQNLGIDITAPITALGIGGIAIDSVERKMYWVEALWIRRANLEIPEGETRENRTDIENLFAVSINPGAITLDLAARKVYWASDGLHGLFRGDMDGGIAESVVASNDGAFSVTGLALDFQQAGVPAVSDVGLAVLVALLLSAGGVVIMKRRSPVPGAYPGPSRE
ncbi:MAG: hypothetical protein IH989_05370 [Planctomycetes bacterium]|nr:hypothetical protein [Planctomycetota bacterium]